MSWPAGRPFYVPAAGVVLAGRVLLRGYNVAETGGSAATFTLWDTSASDLSSLEPLTTQLVATVNVAADGGDTRLPQLGGVVFEQGVAVTFSDGAALTLVLYLSPETRLTADLAVFDDTTHDWPAWKLAAVLMQGGE